MADINAILGAAHLAAGIVALASFWFPLFYRKGGRAHRTAGWVFVGAMTVILASAAVMTTGRVIAGDRGIALFLGFLTLITFSAIWTGIMVLRHKADPAWLRAPVNFVILAVIGVAAVGLLWQWYETRFVLLLAFGIVGLFIALPTLVAWRRPLRVEPRYWWFQHLESMIIAGMAAHIAFFAFGATRIWPNLYSGHPWWLVLLPWVAPFPIAFIAIALTQRHYRRKFTPARRGSGEDEDEKADQRGGRDQVHIATTHDAHPSIRRVPCIVGTRSPSASESFLLSRKFAATARDLKPGPARRGTQG